MINLYLGNYLLRNRLIDTDTLRSVLDLQQDTYLRLGVLAMHEGLMTAEEVQEVHEMQGKVDKKFGEIAVIKGYLTDGQVDDLLHLQARSGAQLTQVLLDRNIFTAREMDEILVKYRKENNLSKEQEEALNQGNVGQMMEPNIAHQCNMMGCVVSKEIVAAGALFIRNLIRFIDRRVVLNLDEEQPLDNELIVIEQNIQGDLPLQTAIAMQEDVYWMMAQNHAKMEIKGDEALAEASVLEFLNLHNGLFTVWLSENEIKATLEPPCVSSAEEKAHLKNWIRIPISINGNQLFFLVSSL